MVAKRIKFLWIPVILAAAALIAWVAPHSAAAETSTPTAGSVLGVVTSPGGYPLPAGTLVKLFEPGTDTVRGRAVPDLANGAFSISVPNGMYVVKAVPPEASGLTQSVPAPALVLNSAVDVGALALTNPQVTGTVFAPDGVTPAHAVITIHLADGHIFQKIDAPTGNYAAGGLPAGEYWFEAFPVGQFPYWRSLPVKVTVAGSAQVVDLNLRPADLWGYALDAEENPVPGAAIVAANMLTLYRGTLADKDGFWTLGGLAPGDYHLVLQPPVQNNGLVAPPPQLVTVPTLANPYTLHFLAPKKFLTGTVLTNSGAPVVDALVVATRVNRPGVENSLTEGDGSYDLHLGSGLWAVTVKPISTTVPADWVYLDAPSLVSFAYNNLPEAHTLDFTVLQADATFTGIITLPEGGAPAFTVTVGLHNGEGIGRRTQVDASGAFTLTVPNGNYKLSIHPEHDNYLAPSLAPVHAGPGETVDLGTIALLARDALITGTVTLAGGEPLAGIPVAAWRAGVPGSLLAQTDDNGVYALAVTSDTWQVRPAPGPLQPYLYTGESATVIALSGQTAAPVDFTLTAADAVISGVLVDEDTLEPLAGAGGWAAAVSSPDAPRDGGTHNGAPIVNGAFTIFVPGGTYHILVFMPAGSEYLSTAERQVTVLPGETEAITIPVRTRDAAITGVLRDPLTPSAQPVSDVAGVVSAWSGNDWVATPINEDNGSYKLEVADGLWRLNYRIDEREYTKIGGAVTVPVAEGQTAIVNLPVTAKDSLLEGVARDPDGSPYPGAVVLAEGTTGVLRGKWFSGRTDENGLFKIKVPTGFYRVLVTGGDPNWIAPAARRIFAGNIAAPMPVFQFTEADSKIQGTLTVTPTLAEGEVRVWAWSSAGGFVEGTFPVTQTGGSAAGVYSLNVVSGTTWHVGAAFETDNFFWSGHGVLDLTGATGTLNLVLSGPYPKPGPMVVTFDPAFPQRIVLADGTAIFIPAGALPADGWVTLRILPLASLPHQQHAEIIQYGYAFLATDEAGQPIEDHFNQDVVIAFRYAEAQLHGLPETWIKPAYFSTTTHQWTFPESYAVDTTLNTITMQIDHFTDFALTITPVTQLFLPVIHR